MKRIANHAFYWPAWICLGLAMFGIALYYQYALDYLPCVLCIQVRVGVLGIVLVALLGWFMRRNHKLHLLAHALNTLLLIALVERAWALLGTERGWIEGSCSMDSGLPGWLALDRWFPALFEVMMPCGYTPELLFGITMAEALLAFFLLGGLLSAMMTIAVMRSPAPGKE